MLSRGSSSKKFTARMLSRVSIFYLETPIPDFSMVFSKTATRSHGRGTKRCFMIMHIIFCFS